MQLLKLWLIFIEDQISTELLIFTKNYFREHP